MPSVTLRDALGKLDRQRPVMTLCSYGKMSYFAARILRQKGFDVTSFAGGHKANINPTIPAKLPSP